MIVVEWLPAVVALALLVWFPVAFAYSAVRAGARSGAKDRRALLSGGAIAVLGLVIGRVFVPWDVIPAALWAIPATVTAWGVLVSIWVWPTLPLVAGPSRQRLRLAGSVIGLAVTVTIIVLLV